MSNQSLFTLEEFEYLRSHPDALTLTLYGEGFEESLKPVPADDSYPNIDFRHEPDRDVHISKAIATFKHREVTLNTSATLKAGEGFTITLYRGF